MSVHVVKQIMYIINRKMAYRVDESSTIHKNEWVMCKRQCSVLSLLAWCLPSSSATVDQCARFAVQWVYCGHVNCWFWSHWSKYRIILIRHILYLVFFQLTTREPCRLIYSFRMLYPSLLQRCLANCNSMAALLLKEKRTAHQMESKLKHNTHARHFSKVMCACANSCDI